MANINGLNASPFLQALGGFFGGYGQDQQLKQQRAASVQKLSMEQDAAARAAEFQRAQMANLDADNKARQDATTRATGNQQTIADSWDAALNGDRQAQARIVSLAPDLAPHFMPKAATPHDPIMGSPEWLAAKDAEKRLDAKYRPNEPKAPIMGTPEYNAALDQELAVRDQHRAPEGPKITDFSNKAALVYPRAIEAAKTLDKYYGSGAPTSSIARHVPLVGNFMVGEDAQSMNQAAETVASAILRLESGAAVSDGEVKSYARQFLPEPGDTPQTRQQKRQMLQTQLEQMREAAAPSAPRSPAAVPGVPRAPSAGSDVSQPGRLTPAQVSRAARDPEYKQFLKATGKMR